VEPRQEDNDVERIEDFESIETESNGNVKELFKYAQSSLNSVQNPLEGDEDDLYDFNEVQAVEMKDNDIEQRIWAQFVRNKSDYTNSSQKSKKSGNLAVSVNSKSTRTNSINVRITTKEAMLSGFEKDIFDDS
jgi:hypothetical protein